MTEKPTYEELEQRVKELEKEAIKRQQVEEALRESEKRFRDTAEMLPSVLIEYDLNGILTYVNPHGYKLAGYEPEDFEEGFHVLRLAAPEEHAKHYERIKKMMQGEKIPPVEYRLLRKDGSTVWGLVNSSLIRKEGNVVGVRTYTIDITERKQAEEALRESEEKYRRIFENIQDVYYEVTLDGIILEISPSIEEVSKYTREELIGTSVYNVYADPEKRDEFVRELLKDGTLTDYKIILKDKDGLQGYYSINAKLLKDENGDPQKIIGSMRNITERVWAEEALKESEEKARVLLNAPTDSLLLIDTEGMVLDLNATASQRLDQSRDEIIGINIYDIFPPDFAKNRKAKASKVIKSGKPISFEDKRDGRILDNTVYPIFDTQGRVVQLAIYSKEITTLRKAIQALEASERDLKIKAKSLEELNTAMKVLLKKREDDKAELEDNVMTNVKELIAPYLGKIKETKLDDQQKAFLSIIESNMNEIISPFTRKLSLKYLKLTPTEIKIANMIKHGNTTKKIANIMNISPRTVDTHRRNIRTKIGLEGKGANLRSHLLAMH